MPPGSPLFDTLRNHSHTKSDHTTVSGRPPGQDVLPSGRAPAGTGPRRPAPGGPPSGVRPPVPGREVERDATAAECHRVRLLRMNARTHGCANAYKYAACEYSAD
ncbi:hypothetical protein CRV15_16555 [Streptomyces clavuligerus]|uniref:Uncharacterized protein n=1 Tax=Streptomyces clavuligerus TaxID=1901 RepID=B5H3I3_STRCL|nr:hypothetical protein D1794_17200 [Streptomyces clavuligerus]EDY53129.1 hypothetical protein SSCG_06169 [Streptomyces clavuligerus]EFG07459.1 Hypothetical protein SCLAV_2386 [Streptomyces clavuligerus]QCS07088.1 hypothetical protein CRV15_16555 [Streptomyces clavuligerus]QPJ93555.1 hypothetical protein GE265_11480 [Streptomyces clavuligerus]